MSQSTYREKLQSCQSGADYLALVHKTNGGRVSPRRAMRALRKARMIDDKLVDADDSVLEIANMRLYDKCGDKDHDVYLHPTKGFRRKSKQRDIFAGQGAKQMWDIITHNLQANVRGKKDQVIRSREWMRTRKLTGKQI